MNPNSLQAQSMLSVNWIPDNCQIVNKAGDVVPLELNDAQLHTEAVILSMERQELPVRVVVLKARQLGETTRGCGKLFYRANTKENFRSLFAAHDDKSTKNVFQRVHFFQENNPRQRKTQKSSVSELRYSSPHNSFIFVDTGGNKGLGRSDTYDSVHISELARFPHPEATMGSVKQCVPSRVGTEVCVESTALGRAGYFYKLYCEAKKSPGDKNLEYMVIPEPLEEDWNGFYRVFNPWFLDSEYRRTPPKDFALTEKEVLLKAKFHLDDHQVYWRRLCVASECDGDEKFFDQEYAETDESAFIHSGRPVFSGTRMDIMFKQCTDAHFVGQMMRFEVKPDDDDDETSYLNEKSIECRVEAVADQGGNWLEIWETPQPGMIYAIGADTAEGKDPEETNDKKKTDANSAHVIDIKSKRVVAKMSGRFDPDIFAEQLDYLGRYYNDALLGPEVNNTSGGSVRSGLRRLNYPNLYHKEILTKDLDQDTENVGWYTDVVTRGQLVADLTHAIRNSLVHVPSEATVHQLRGWQWDKNGKATHAVGEHDDDGMSIGIAWQMAAVAALVGTREVAESAGEYVNEREDEFTSDMVIGGLEPEPVLAEDDNGEYW